IRLKALGEDHPDTASSYNNLAWTFDRQGKYAEAHPLYRGAAAICLEALVRDPQGLASGFNTRGAPLQSLGQAAAGDGLTRRALAIRLKALGEDHRDTASSYNNLALSVDRQGKHADALPLWSAAAASYEGARLRGAKGLESALSAGGSPLPSFALALARAGQ